MLIPFGHRRGYVSPLSQGKGFWEKIIENWWAVSRGCHPMLCLAHSLLPPWSPSPMISKHISFRGQLWKGQGPNLLGHIHELLFFYRGLSTWRRNQVIKFEQMFIPRIKLIIFPLNRTYSVQTNCNSYTGRTMDGDEGNLRRPYSRWENQWWMGIFALSL